MVPRRSATVAATIVNDMLTYLERQGHARAALCRAAGVDAARTTQPDERLRVAEAMRLWQCAEQVTGDPLLGLHMAEAFHPAALDILGYVLLTCADVGEVLDRVARYAPLLNDGVRVVVVPEGRQVVVRLEAVAGLDNPMLDDARQIVESWWAGLAKQLRLLPVTPVHAAAVHFRHVAAGPLSEYRRVFPDALLRFGAARDEVRLRASDLRTTLPSANPLLLGLFERHAAQALAALAAREAVAGRTAREIAARLRGRQPAIGDVAAALAMSARQLQRTLQAEGTTYQQLLDDVRRSFAESYLADPAHSIGQVAFLLGFSEPAAFHRAFRRWTGRTPAAARRSLREAAQRAHQ